MGKYVLVFGGVFTAVFGLSFIFTPHMFFELYTGGDFTTTSAAIDVRSTYGGFSLGIGLFLLYCSQQNIRMGLMAALFALMCIIPARLMGYMLDGAPNGYMYIFLGLEILLLLLSALALRQTKHAE